MKKQLIDSIIGLSALFLVLAVAGLIFLSPAAPKSPLTCSAVSCVSSSVARKQSAQPTTTPAFVAAVSQFEHVRPEQNPVPTEVQPTSQNIQPSTTPAPTAAPTLSPTEAPQITQGPSPQNQQTDEQSEPQQQYMQNQQNTNIVEQTLQPVGNIVSGVTSLIQ